MTTYQQPNARETEQLWSKIWKPRQHKKADWISNMAKELRIEGCKAEVNIGLLRMTLKNIKLENVRP